MTLTITLSHPSNKPNGHMPLCREAAVRANYAKMGTKMKERRDGYMAALVALRRLPDNHGKVQAFVPTGYRIVWYYKGVRPDADNIVARCKHILDGCALAFGANDKNWEFGGVQRVHDKSRNGQVELVFNDGELFGNSEQLEGGSDA